MRQAHGCLVLSAAKSPNSCRTFAASPRRNCLLCCSACPEWTAALKCAARPDGLRGARCGHCQPQRGHCSLRYLIRGRPWHLDAKWTAGWMDTDMQVLQLAILDDLNKDSRTLGDNCAHMAESILINQDARMGHTGEIMSSRFGCPSDGQKRDIPDICHPYPWPGKDCRVGRSPTRSSLTCRSPRKLSPHRTPSADVTATYLTRLQRSPRSR
jgi:hypothetical protein